jgi:flagellum-specific peptidoglycan hydrolase FlgJ
MPSQTQLAALATFAPAAVQAEKATGLPAAISCAQWAFESAWGTRGIDSNVFGIKADQRGSGEVYVLTSEYLNGEWEKMPLAFETYATVADCVADHARLITQSKPYAAAWSDYEQSAKDCTAVEMLMVAIGPIYATNPNYVNEMIAMMREPYLVGAVNAAREAA